jgi:hypothetical protein
VILENDLDFLHCSEFAVALQLDPTRKSSQVRSLQQVPNAISPDKSLILGAKPGASRWPARPAESTARASDLPGAPAPSLREVTHAADI